MRAGTREYYFVDTRGQSGERRWSFLCRLWTPPYFSGPGCWSTTYRHSPLDTKLKSHKPRHFVDNRLQHNIQLMKIQRRPFKPVITPCPFSNTCPTWHGLWVLLQKDPLTLGLSAQTPWKYHMLRNAVFTFLGFTNRCLASIIMMILFRGWRLTLTSHPASGFDIR